jgi:hypothetical protein
MNTRPSFTSRYTSSSISTFFFFLPEHPHLTADFTFDCFSSSYEDPRKSFLITTNDVRQNLNNPALRRKTWWNLSHENLNRNLDESYDEDSTSNRINFPIHFIQHTHFCFRSSWQPWNCSCVENLSIQFGRNCVGDCNEWKVSYESMGRKLNKKSRSLLYCSNPMVLIKFCTLLMNAQCDEIL